MSGVVARVAVLPPRLFEFWSEIAHYPSFSVKFLCDQPVRHKFSRHQIDNYIHQLFIMEITRRDAPGKYSWREGVSCVAGSKGKSDLGKYWAERHKMKEERPQRAPAVPNVAHSPFIRSLTKRDLMIGKVNAR